MHMCTLLIRNERLEGIDEIVASLIEEKSDSTQQRDVGLEQFYTLTKPAKK